MYNKVLTYVYNCWYGVHCHKKEDIEKIVKEIIKENPNETRITKLGMLAKRRCIERLT